MEKTQIYLNCFLGSLKIIELKVVHDNALLFRCFIRRTLMCMCMQGVSHKLALLK